MKIQKDAAVKNAEALVKSKGIPFDSVEANHVDKGYWQIAFKQKQDKSLMDGLVTFVQVDDETGQATLQAYP